jgi:hypothetical protein
VRRKDLPPKGVGKPDILSRKGMEVMDAALRDVLGVSREEVDRRERGEAEAQKGPVTE